MTGWWWLGLGAIAIIGSTMYFSHFRMPFFYSRPVVVDPLPPVDQRVLEVLAGLRTPALTRAMVVVAGLSSQWMIAALVVRPRLRPDREGEGEGLRPLLPARQGAVLLPELARL